MSTAIRHSDVKRVLSPEYALLGLLMLGPDHGYDLHQRLMTDLGNVWHLSQSQAYSILRRLQEHGDVAAAPARRGMRPRRQVLRITPTGQRRFRRWLDGAAKAGARTVRLEFLTRLYFTRLLMPDRTARVYLAQKREVALAIARLRLLHSQVPQDQVFNRMSLDLRLRQMEMIRLWLQESQIQFASK